MRQNGVAVKRGEFPPTKGNASLALWKWFWFVESETELATPRCKAYFKARATKGNSTTKHLKQKHAAEWEKCCSVCNEPDCSRGSSTSTKKQPTVLEYLTNFNTPKGLGGKPSQMWVVCVARVDSNTQSIVIWGYVGTLFDQPWWGNMLCVWRRKCFQMSGMVYIMLKS